MLGNIFKTRNQSQPTTPLENNVDFVQLPGMFWGGLGDVVDVFSGDVWGGLGDMFGRVLRGF